MTKVATLVKDRAIDTARALELGDLWRQAMRWGLPSLTTFPAERGFPVRFSTGIKRQVGKSELKTSHKTFERPERALLHAIEEAELWGLPELTT